MKLPEFDRNLAELFYSRLEQFACQFGKNEIEGDFPILRQIDDRNLARYIAVTRILPPGERFEFLRTLMKRSKSCSFGNQPTTEKQRLLLDLYHNPQGKADPYSPNSWDELEDDSEAILTPRQIKWFANIFGNSADESVLKGLYCPTLSGPRPKRGKRDDVFVRFRDTFPDASVEKEPDGIHATSTILCYSVVTSIDFSGRWNFASLSTSLYTPAASGSRKFAHAISPASVLGVLHEGWDRNSSKTYAEVGEVVEAWCKIFYPALLKILDELT